ncbi:MAG: 3-hydroxyacyl-CoA dehydrogenase family protein [Anaerolineae bacterium]|nr:3-hydroxyacyl-CoA dehydrogenase family protein [Anaerolineae bacterium]
MGLAVMWMNDSRGLILTRIISQIINEAAFAVGEGVADMATIDVAMKLGVNYAAGPFEWGKQIGYHRIVSVLDNLYDYYHEDRYRVAPHLRRLADS